MLIDLREGMSLREAEELSGLIGQIYDAALAPALWPDVLATTARFVGGRSAALYAKNEPDRTGNVFYRDDGVDLHYVDLYFTKYVKLDPSTTAHFHLMIGDVVRTNDYMPVKEFRESRFYKEWAEPQGWVDATTAMLDKSATSRALYTVFHHRADDSAERESRARCKLLVPHLRRAMLVHQAIEAKTAEAATLTETLDGLVAGSFLVDETGRLVHTNSAGRRMLAEADLLHTAGDRLVADDPESDQRLRDVCTTAAYGDTALGAKGIAVPLKTRRGNRYVGHVLPLTSSRRSSAGKAFAAVAALFVNRAELEMPAVPEIIAKTYALTPTELRVLLAIVEVGGAPEVAEALGISESTVKTHLGRLYEKTGARRHADLVKLVAGFSNPLAV
jgi:DNA-binding CsgD family transcriptional regulator